MERILFPILIVLFVSFSNSEETALIIAEETWKQQGVCPQQQSLQQIFWLAKCSIRCSASSYSCLYFVILMTSFHIIESMSKCGQRNCGLQLVCRIYCRRIAQLSWMFSLYKKLSEKFSNYCHTFMDRHTIHTIICPTMCYKYLSAAG